jgi:SHS2 domain-containing protein
VFEVFDHTADIGLRVRAKALEELFCEAGVGLFSLIVSNVETVRSDERVDISIAAREGELDFLLFDWLNELLFTFDSKKMLLARFDVSIRDSQLKAVAWGEPLDPTRHRLEHEVKAITYHGLKVTQEADSWEAEVILDI